MNTAAAAFLVGLLSGPADPSEGPAVQKPASLSDQAEPAPAQPSDSVVAEPDAAPTDPEQPPAADAEPVQPETPQTVAVEPEPEPAVEQPEAVEPSEAADLSETLRVSEGSGESGPPYYSEADAKAFRETHGVAEPDAPQRQARWRCLIADPTCGFNFEINATSAYAHRFQQGDVRSSNARNWASGRAQYDFWANIPVLVEQEGRTKYTRMTLGPKGGVAFSDGGDLWGNLGVAARYWFRRGRWSPTLEFTSALSFKIGSRETEDIGTSDPKFRMSRGPVGFTADIGIGLGGFGALIVGGQYDSPLAREDIPEQFRVSAGGAFFVGFRGNILWGGPAAAAIATHTLTQRFAEEAR